jgi:hypothetical protein
MALKHTARLSELDTPAAALNHSYAEHRIKCLEMEGDGGLGET